MATIRRDRSRREALRAAFVLAALVVLPLAAPAAAGATNWTSLRTLNITHQGGENEAPSATMYSFERSMKLGSDMLEVDVHATRDGKLAIIHDATVDRTTNGTGMVSAMTMNQLRRLDAAHWFIPGRGARRGAPAGHYVFRGVRTGERRPPRGYRPADFRVLELDELISRYPDVPINIEIKGSDADVFSFFRNAEVLASYLNGLGRTEGIMVASFNDLALARFHQLAPGIDLAPAIVGVAAFKFAGLPPPPGTKAFQVPLGFEGIPITDRDFVNRAHAGGYGVHVWTINAQDEIRRLLGWGVDGIMTAEPARLERVLCAAKVKRPRLPRSAPGRHCEKRVSLACSVRATKLQVRGDRARVTLVRRDPFGSRCAGEVTIRAGRDARVGRFSFGWAGTGKDTSGARSRAELRLGARLARRLEGGRPAAIGTRPWDGFLRRATLRAR